MAASCRPYVETCVEAFGASRSMFESNFPVDKVSYSYQVFWNACKLMAKGTTSTEKPICSRAPPDDVIASTELTERNRGHRRGLLFCFVRSPRAPGGA